MEDWDIGERLHSTGNDRIGVTQQDLVRRIVDRLRGGGTGAVQGVGRDTGRQLWQETYLTRHVRGHGGRDHLAEYHLVDLAAVYLAAVEQLPTDVPRHCHGGHVAKHGATLGKRS